MRPNELLDAAIKGASLRGDADLCRLLNWASGKVSQYRNNKKWPDNNAARLLAEAAGLDPLLVIGELEVAKATDEATRTAWGKALARRLKPDGFVVPGLLFLILAACAALIFLGRGSAFSGLATLKAVAADNVYYVNIKTSTPVRVAIIPHHRSPRLEHAAVFRSA